MRALGALAALLLVSAACTPLPRPFERARAPDGAVPPAHLGNDSLLVLPVAGTPGDGGRALADEVAARLRVAGIPATSRPDGGGGMRVAGKIADDMTAPVNSEILRVTVAWTLRARNGDTETLRTAGVVPTGEWSLASPLALTRLAAATVPDLVAALRPGVSGPAVPLGGPAVALWSVDGAPGDDGAALATAMRHALRNRGIAGARGDEGTAVLLGSVHRSPVGGGQEEIEIMWTLIRLDGKELGRVRQTNTLRVGQLDGVWGPVADAVAEAGADAIAALIGETVTKGQANLP